MTTEERVKKVKELHNNVNATVFGTAFHDADTILVDLQEEGLEVDATGVANEIFGIYEKTADKKAVENGSLDDPTELVGQIMDQVENFMEEREGTEEPILVGDNYDNLSRSVTETLQNWGLLPKEGA